MPAGRMKQDATHIELETPALACDGDLPGGVAGIFVLARREEVCSAAWWDELTTSSGEFPVGMIVQAVGKDVNASKLSKSVVPAVCC